MSMAKELHYYLTLNCTGLTTANTWVNKAPQTPATGVTIHEAGGSPPTPTFGSTPTFESPHFQIVARSTLYPTARSLAESVYRKLQTVKTATLLTSAASTASTVYLSINPMQAPFPLGEDDAGRYLIACNYATKKGLSA